YHLSFHCSHRLSAPHSFPTRRSSDLATPGECTLARRTAHSERPSTAARHRPRTRVKRVSSTTTETASATCCTRAARSGTSSRRRSEEHTSELQSRENLVCRLLLEKKK